MRQCNIYIKLFVVTLGIYIFLIEECDCADKLDFWVPDPRFKIRRSQDFSDYTSHDHRSRISQRRGRERKWYVDLRKSNPHRTRNPLDRNTNKLRNNKLFRSGEVYRKRTNRNVLGFNTQSAERIHPAKQKKVTQENNKINIRNSIINLKSRSTRITPNIKRQENQEEEKKIEEPKKSVPQNENKKLVNDPIPINALEKINAYSYVQQFKKLMLQFPHVNVTTETLGRTVEYNDIVMLKVAQIKNVEKYFRADESKFVDDEPEKRIIFIVHGLSVMGIHKLYALSKMGYLNKLLSYYFNHLDKFDIYLIPLANPDGYALTDGEIWNKNLSPQVACNGVALDRNFDVAWNSSNFVNSCSQHYPGSKPFSEAETRAISDVFHRYGHKIIAYLNVHSNSYDGSMFKGDSILYPPGFTEEVQADGDKYIDLKAEIDEAMKNASFRVMSFTVDSLYNWYGQIMGSSVDYASSVYGITYAMELAMQPYLDTGDSTTENELALTEIWGRVLEVVFNHIYRTTSMNET